MNTRLFLARAALTALGVSFAAQVVPGIECHTTAGLVAASLLLGFLNAFARPFLVQISLPLVILSFGLFFWFINAGLLMLVSTLVESFEVASFGSALVGSAVIGFVSWIVGGILGVRRWETAAARPGSPPFAAPGPEPGPAPWRAPGFGGARGNRGGDPGGPVIDV